MQGRYVQASLLHERSQAIRDKVLYFGHPDVADSFVTGAKLLHFQVGADRGHDLKIK